jgi:hypothetical protein
MTVCTVISLLKIPYVHRVYLKMYGFGQPNTFANTQVWALAVICGGLPADVLEAVQTALRKTGIEQLTEAGAEGSKE